MNKREHIPAKLRHEVFQRDNYRCRECGATNKETTLEIDHILPVSKGGTNDINNLQTLCKKCNRAKYTRTWVGGAQNNHIHENNDDLYELNRKQRKINLNKHYSKPNHNPKIVEKNTISYPISTRIKKCPYCDTIINRKAKKCAKCGNKINKSNNKKTYNKLKEKHNDLHELNRKQREINLNKHKLKENQRVINKNNRVSVKNADHTNRYVGNESKLINKFFNKFLRLFNK